MVEKEDKSSQHKKELKSLRNRMNGPNLVWFDSLSIRKKYDLLFEWKKTKFRSIDSIKIDYRLIYNRYTRKKEYKKHVTYPCDFKHFIELSKKRVKYRVKHSDKRNTIIDILLKEK